jgi:RNA polymerase sigma-70 factor, ECF subfamily
VAEDVVAETLAIAWRKFDDIPGGERELAYIYGIEKGVIANTRRSLRRRRRLAERVRADHLVHNETAVLSSPDIEIATAFGRLRPADREILMLRYWESLSYREIGTILNCSESAVTSRLNRARIRLKTLLVEMSGDGQEASGETRD